MIFFFFFVFQQNFDDFFLSIYKTRTQKNKNLIKYSNHMFKFKRDFCRPTSMRFFILFFDNLIVFLTLFKLSQKQK